MRFRLTILALAALVTWLLVSVAAQETRDADWPLHNLDLKNSRFSPLDQVASLRVKVVGDTVNPGPGAPGFRESFHDADHSALKVSQTVAAYDALTGAQVWRTEFPGVTNAGNLVTGGDVLFQAGGSGNFFAFDARTGRQLFKFSAKVISGSPLTYQVLRKQYVTTIAGNTVLTFSLP